MKKTVFRVYGRIPAGTEAKAIEKVELIVKEFLGEEKYRECGIIRVKPETYDIGWMVETVDEMKAVAGAVLLWTGNVSVVSSAPRPWGEV